ncbi:MAG: heme biosynthesis HemY N-terminal domain-containing protein, partial [Burkholderiales bacterium]
MRWVFWILALFALAVIVALALRFNAGYALLVWPPYRVEISLNLLLMSLGAAFVAGYLLLRFIFGAIGLPAKVRAYRARRRLENARATLLEAV